MWSFGKNKFSLSLLLGILLSFELGLASHPSWKPARATWYGDPDGNGSNGGACGYGTLVDVLPYKTHITAVSRGLYQNGLECGSCYTVICTDKKVCSGKPIDVIVTDECPGCSETHFDLSGAAFSHLSIPGGVAKLRTTGVLPILYRRTSCKYPGKKIGFRVNQGSSAYWLSLLVVYEIGDGDIGAIHIRQAKSKDWMPMAHSWGASWFITGKGPLKGPFSVKVTTLSNKKTLMSKNVIPSNFVPGPTYTAHLKKL